MRVEANGIRFTDHDYDDISVEVDSDGVISIEQSGEMIHIALDDTKQFATELLAWAKKAVA